MLPPPLPQQLTVLPSGPAASLLDPIQERSIFIGQAGFIVNYFYFQPYSILPSKPAHFYFLNISLCRSIDSSEALKLPGVVDVITAEDIPGTNGAEADKLLAVDEVRIGPVLPNILVQIITKGPSSATSPFLPLSSFYH
jgi:hypothetical protein